MPTSKRRMKYSQAAMPPRCCRSRGSASVPCSRDRSTARHASCTGRLRMVREGNVREHMALRLLRALTCAVLLLLVAAAPARAEDKDGLEGHAPDEAVQRAYAMISPRIRAEYGFQLRGVAQQV